MGQTNNTNLRNPMSRYSIYIIGILLLIIGYLVIFNTDDSTDDIKEREKRIEELIRLSEDHKRRADSLESTIAKYEKIADEYRIKDSLKLIEIERQKEITRELLEQQRIARIERERVEKELTDFKNNPPKYNLEDPNSLLIDFRRRVEAINNKKERK